MTSEVAVLGCGPSGLVAANAVEQMGHHAVVFSDIKKSWIAGAQFSQEAILGHNRSSEPEGTVKFMKQGTRAGYARKVYGDPEAPVSWSRYEARDYPAWNLKDTYDALWEHWRERMVPLHLSPADARQMAWSRVVEGVQFDAVVSAIPLKALCDHDGHQFHSHGIYIVQYENEYPRDTQSFILYNGEPEPAWYRESVVFGSHAYEWSDQLNKKPPIDGIKRITKPFWTTCDCFTEAEHTGRFRCVGRYGRWHEPHLINDVQRDVVNLVWELNR